MMRIMVDMPGGCMDTQGGMDICGDLHLHTDRRQIVWFEMLSLPSNKRKVFQMI